jgi:hypothetical protein
LNFNAALGTGEMVTDDTETITLDVQLVKKILSGQSGSQSATGTRRQSSVTAAK